MDLRAQTQSWLNEEEEPGRQSPTQSQPECSVSRNVKKEALVF